MKKTLKITYLKKAVRFLSKNKDAITESDVDRLIVFAVKKIIHQKDINLDIKALRGSLKGKFRIRKGKIRIIFEIVEDEIILESIVADIDFRGNIY